MTAPTPVVQAEWALATAREAEAVLRRYGEEVRVAGSLWTELAGVTARLPAPALESTYFADVLAALEPAYALLGEPLCPLYRREAAGYAAAGPALHAAARREADPACRRLAVAADPPACRSFLQVLHRPGRPPLVLATFRSQRVVPLLPLDLAVLLRDAAEALLPRGWTFQGPVDLLLTFGSLHLARADRRTWWAVPGEGGLAQEDIVWTHPAVPRGRSRTRSERNPE